MRYQKLLAFAAAASTATALACSQAAPPTSPASATPGSLAANPDGSTLKVNAPVAVSPSTGLETTDLTPELVINNSSALYVNSLPLTYVFEVSNPAGAVVYRSNPIAAGANGRTSHEIVGDLANDVTYSWRAHAVYQGQRGPRSNASTFKTLNRFGVSCAKAGSPFGIVACRFAQHGNSHMDPDEAVEFLTEVAYDLNQTGISDKGGFGLLVKTTGNHCNGYSCDIICEGNGPRQSQYDILIDDRAPNWAQVDNPTVRPCIIVR